jgi:hypothetical protein
MAALTGKNRTLQMPLTGGVSTQTERYNGCEKAVGAIQ